MITLNVPIDLPSIANKRMHWAAKAGLVKKQREAVRLTWIKAGKPSLPVPSVVTLIRCAPRPLDDDNCVSAGKACRDELASIIGVDDRDPRVTWRYAQEKTKTRSVLIMIEGVAA